MKRQVKSLRMKDAEGGIKEPASWNPMGILCFAFFISHPSSLILCYHVQMKIRPARCLRGSLRLPGDKSISHRAAIIAALAKGRTRIGNFSTSADCAATLACLAELGLRVERAGDAVLIEGGGTENIWQQPARPLDCANSGTTMRLLAGALAAQPFASVLTGDASLSRRPMRRIIEPLEMMGARISATDGRAPLTINGRRPLRAISYALPIASAQVKSCILLAGLQAEGRTSVRETLADTRDHTERLLRWFGAEIETKTERGAAAERAQATLVAVNGPSALTARDTAIPGDISSAAYFIVAAALLPGSSLRLHAVGLNPTRTLFLDRLRAWGADVRLSEQGAGDPEPQGEIAVRGGEGLRPDALSALRGASIAQLIDELPLLAVAGTQMEGGLEIRDASELRAKESDRIAATVANLRAMGAEVEEYQDGLLVAARARLRGALLDARGDHRIAMAFAVAALLAEGESEIAGAEECVGVSFPEFFRLLEAVTER